MRIRHIYLLFAAAIATTATAADSLHIPQLSSRHWVKISTDTTGIFQISGDELRSWGFESADKVSIYGCGAVAAASHGDIPHDGLCRAASTVTDDDRLLFYSEGPVRAGVNPSTSTGIAYQRNSYDTHSYYYITDSTSPAELPLRAFSPNFDSIYWHYAIELIENEVQNYGKGGIFNHDRRLQAGEQAEFTFEVRDFYDGADAPDCIFKVEAGAKSPNSVSLDINTVGKIEVTSTNTKLTIPASTAPNRLYMPSSNGMVHFRPGTVEDKRLSFSITLPATFTGSYFAVDKSWLKYPQKHVFDGRNDFFINLNATEKGRNIKVEGITPYDRIWDISDPTDITNLELHATDGGVLATPLSNSTRRLVAFSLSATHPSVNFVGIVEPQSLHNLSTPEMLIVCSDICRDSAEELAEIHRSLQGMDVKVVSQNEVFNEYSSGSKHPGAIRRFAKDLYDRNPGRLRYLLLYGAADYSHTSGRSGDFLVCFENESYDQSRDATTNYCCDQYFGMLGSDFNISTVHTKGRMLISVGRIPALAPYQGKTANEKIRRRLEAQIPARKYLHSLFLSDTGNEHAHLRLASEVAATLLAANSALTVVRADSELFPLGSGNADKGCKALVDKTLRSGVGFFNYCGHGDETALSTFLYDKNSASSKQYGEYPFAMLATCDTYPLDRSSNSITDHMIFNPDGGMIAAISSCRSVYLDLNGVLAKSVADAYANATPLTCTGDILKEARSAMLDSYNGTMPIDLGLNLMCYNMCGDPAIPLGAPDYGFGEISLSGNVAGSSEISLPALDNVSLHAAVIGNDGKILSSFNGRAIIDVYDTPQIRKNLNGAYDDVVCDDAIAATFSAPVINGIVDTSFAIPMPRGGEGLHRIVLTAIDSDSREQAAGVVKDISISKSNGDYASDIDTAAPLIEQFYIDSIGSDNITAPNFTIVAVIHDSGTGIAPDNTGISNVSQLRIDGRVLQNAAAGLEPQGDGSYILRHSAGPLPTGRHSTTFKAVSNSGKSSSATIDFIVDYVAKGSLTADVSDPVRESVNLSLTTDMAEITDCRITVEAADGSVVCIHNGAPDFTWNLTDKNGNPVPDGLYRAWALFSTLEGKGHTPAVELMVVKSRRQ